jgi:two-component system response regulator DesR
LARGEPVLDVELAVAALTAKDNPLTDRELDVLRLARNGAPTKEIASNLYLSAGTVRNHLARIVLKTGARTRQDAIRIAQDAGWI